MSLAREFAGAQRVFNLRFGDVMDLEEACGKVPIGTLYKRVTGFDFRAKDILEILRLGLIGGGMEAAEARRLVVERLDAGRLAPLVELAAAVLLTLMDGVPESAEKSAAEPVPFDAGAIYHGFAQVGIAPQQVNAMRFGDALKMFAAAHAKGRVAAPSIDDHEALMARFASGALDWARGPTPAKAH